ncbi:MAG TPA: glycoside hydrolase family 28 protein [Tepidisphaeraceae bacterium]|jgi:polygalacturonase
MRRYSSISILILSLLSGCAVLSQRSGNFDVRSYGAHGDGHHLDTNAINRAIKAASNAGGGTVTFPAGNYLSYSIHLRSNVTLYLDSGATIVAADPREGEGYDAPEANLAGVPDLNHEYQDFGHSHWHNSLLWGDNLQNVAIMGPGKIYGKGLARSQPHAQHPSARNATDIPQNDSADAQIGNDGVGNKMIALKNCRNVILRDVTLQHGGWFAILATGVDNLTIDNLKIDTNRDGMDIDCCQNVRVSNCTVNSPHDDGICLKSSFGLGYVRSTRNVTITNCQVSGYVEGSLLDGTYRHDPNPKFSPTGRIKFGTESNGGFQNITISNCIFDYCRGFALESVDGALLEDVSISNITMRDISSAPIFIRLGTRLRGPASSALGTCQRINISNVVAYNVNPRESCIISGIPHYRINDLTLSHIQIYFRGGGLHKLATSRPLENEAKYPEPSMFGEIPSYGFFIRHADNVKLDHIMIGALTHDERSPFVLTDVHHIDLDHIDAPHSKGIPFMRSKDVTGLRQQ